MVRGGVQGGERWLSAEPPRLCGRMSGYLSSCYHVAVGVERRPMPNELPLPRVDPSANRTAPLGQRTNSYICCG